MRNNSIFFVALAAVVGLGACDDGGGTDQQVTLQPEAGIRDAFVETDGGRPDARPDTGAGGEGGMGGVGGMGGEGGQGGAGGGIRMLATCDDICAVYADCGVEAATFPGGAAECRARCAEAQASDRFNDYLTCMQITRCEDLARCAIPERPLPACADVCTALAACDPAPRLPAGLPGIAACADACADGSLARVVSSCGADAVDGQCDAAGFDACVLQARGGACALECTTRAGCDPAVDATTCTLECLAAVAPEDPIAARRVDQARACVRNAADCDELAACDARRQRPIVGEHTIEELCAANAVCGFLSVEGCADVAAELLPRLADGAIDCFTEHFTDQCGEAPYACFDPAPAPEGGCEEHCLVSDLCGLLPDDQSEFDCLEICQGALASGDPTAIDPYLPFFECAFLGTCDDISSCQLDADFQASCQAMCTAQIECGSPGAAECFDECLARPATRRMKAERACIAVADGCENVNLCLAPSPPDCAALCEPLDDCRLTDRRCPISCDDADFADPAGFLPLLSCVNSTARCGDRGVCVGGDTGGGDLCLAWCQARVGCAQNPAQTMTECVLECGRGEVGGQRGLVLASAAECLLAIGAGGACPDLRACIDDADFHGFCPAYCADLARCRLEDDVVACEAACRGVEDDAGFFAEAACALNAERRGESCEAIATCVGAELPPIPRGCRQVCEAEARCDDGVDAFLCGLDCDPAREGLDIEAGCAHFAPCDQLGRCADPPLEVPRGCAAACGVIAGCGGLVGPDGTFEDFDHCTAECAGASILLGAGFPARLQACAEDAACDADEVIACFMVPEDVCEAGQEAVTACGLDQSPIPGFPPLVADYLGDCQRLQMQDPAAALAQVQCLEAAAQRAAGGDPLACFDAFACGVGGLLMPGLLAPVVLALPGIFGVELGQDAAQVQAAFAPVVEGKGAFSEISDPAGVRLDYRCAAEARCFGLPADATFRFVDGKLVMAELLFSAAAAPPGKTAAQVLEAAFQGRPVAAKAEAVGRVTRYVVDAAATLAWTQDGSDARVVLALDAAAPVLRAEAASAGAPAGALDTIPGARAWQRGHAAVAERRFDDAVKAFDAVVGATDAPVLLGEPARLLLAMSLAARASAAGPSPAALADVARARALAPDLADDLDDLRRRLTPAADQ